MARLAMERPFQPDMRISLKLILTEPLASMMSALTKWALVVSAPIS